MQGTNGSQPAPEPEPPEVCCYNVYYVDGTVSTIFSDEDPARLESRLNKEVSLATKGVFRFVRVPQNAEAVGYLHWVKCSLTQRGVEVLEVLDEDSALEEREALKKEQAAALAAGKQLFQVLEIREIEVKETILRTDLIARIEAAPHGDDDDEDDDEPEGAVAAPPPERKKGVVSKLPAGFTQVPH